MEMAPFHVCHIFDDVDDRLWPKNTLLKFVVDNYTPIKNKTYFSYEGSSTRAGDAKTFFKIVPPYMSDK